MQITEEQYRALIALPWFWRDGQAITPISEETEGQLGLDIPVGTSELRVL